MVKVLRGLSLLGARAAPPRAPIPETLVVNAAEQATLVSNGPPVFLPPPPTPPVAADNNQTVISPPDLPKRPPTEPSLIVDQRPDPRRQWMLVSALGLLIAVVGLALILLFK